MLRIAQQTPMSGQQSEPDRFARESFGGIAPALRGGAMSIAGIAPALRGGAMSMRTCRRVSSGRP